MKIDVDNGRFVISDVCVTRRAPGVLVLSCDCRSKYPEVAAYGGGSVMIRAGERSLWLNETAATELTTVTLPRFARDWEIAADCGRYTVRIVAWKPRRRMRVLRTRKDDQ